MRDQVRFLFASFYTFKGHTKEICTTNQYKFSSLGFEHKVQDFLQENQPETRPQWKTERKFRIEGNTGAYFVEWADKEFQIFISSQQLLQLIAFKIFTVRYVKPF